MPALQELATTLGQARARYIQQNPKSKALHAEAANSLPGGNTRAVLHADPFPLYIKSGRGYQVTSEDNATYTDFTGEFTAALYGHSPPVIQNTITTVLTTIGLNLSGTIRAEQSLARAICARFNVSKVRFTNSGTEANLQALAAARRFTKKRKVVVFGGAYHGGVLGFAGGKPAANNVDLDDWIVAKYNDVDGATRAIQDEGVAAVLLEAMQGAGGCVVATEEFLKAVEDAARKAGVVFILDEVMTSRLCAHGLASIRSITPDLKTFGKWLGGGITFGAFGGREDIMAAYDPSQPDPLPHSGTFNNNTLAMHAGYAGLTEVYTPSVADEFTALGTEFLRRLNGVSRYSILCFTGLGTVMTAHFPVNGEKDIRDGADVEERSELKELFWLEMLENGFWVARRGLIALILGTPRRELDRFVDAVEAFIQRYEAFLKPTVG
ncbi:hypothetical protein J3458_003469 [Metarhizium acridum]|uniref:uncharacterized protein n=1 Tax=Metarhizium acridum TaxID=92637 RepID=UPI001C6C03CB|nr:hypothetical protein J3458_003469 [Metarhizium acridum]